MEGDVVVRAYGGEETLGGPCTAFLLSLSTTSAPATHHSKMLNLSLRN